MDTPIQRLLRAQAEGTGIVLSEEDVFYTVLFLAVIEQHLTPEIVQEMSDYVDTHFVPAG